MNKLNFFLLTIISIGVVGGCKFAAATGEGNHSRQEQRSGDKNRDGQKTSEQGKKQARGTDSDDENNDTDDAERGSSTGGDTARLAGKWVWARTGNGTYNTGGGYVGGNGSRFTYEFSDDGAVEFTGIMNVMQGGCLMQVFNAKKGVAELSGDTLTISWSPVDFSRDDSCDTAGNYKKTLPAETETLTVSFKDDAGQRQLCLTGKDETCFSPAE